MERNFVLFLDPSDRNFYKYDLKENTVSPAGSVTIEFKNKIDTEIEKFELLRGFEITDWDFESEEAQNYRKRAIWQYLLHPECSKTPLYITSKELSSAFAEVTDIVFTIDISEYFPDFSESSEEEKFEEKAAFCVQRNDKTVDLKVSLMSNTQETIRKLRELIFKALGIEIQPKDPENVLALKVIGKKEYFVRNIGFIFFRSIRESLRGMQNLNLRLTEIPKKSESNFPQLLLENELPKSVENFLMFYSPLQERPTPRLASPRIFSLKAHKPLNERQSSSQSLLKGIKAPEKIFTGEVDWPFRVKILGIDDFYKVFIDAFHGRALKNGTEHPNYVVSPKEKSIEKKHSKTPKKPSSDRRQSINLIKSKSKSTSKSSLASKIFTNYTDHCANTDIMNSLSNFFNLPFTPYLLSFDIMLIYGEEIIENCKVQTEYCPFSYNARLSNWITFPIKLSNLPKETRIGVNIYAVSKSGEASIMASAVKSIFDETGMLRQGKIALKLWPFYRIENRLACMQEFWGNSGYDNVDFPGPLELKLKYLINARLFFQLDSFTADTIWSLKEETYLKSQFKLLSGFKRTEQVSIRKFKGSSKHNKEKLTFPASVKCDEQDVQDLKLLAEKPQIDDLANLEQILFKDPLESLSDEEKRILIICRNHYLKLPMALQLFLRAINWTRPVQVKEAHKMLNKWTKMQFEDMISLLNAEYADETVRLYCVQQISQISDEDFVLYMPQLVQALCFETCHFSALGELIIERSLQNPQLVGHSLFWALRGQLHVKATAERFGLILEQFLMLCGNFRDVLLSEVNYVKYMMELASKLSTRKDYEEKEKLLKNLLSENLDSFRICTLPIDCALESDGIISSQCKVMNSKKMPLWIEMKSEGESDQGIPIIFKVGDDLRQDILTLQMIKVMDRIWLENGLDLRMRTYRVVVTGDQSGIIECVPNSTTTSDIQTKYGGTLGALRKNTILDYINECNPSESSKNKALDNFVRSCAGYCVASYILGIADRHNGNIMITKTGHLFHIDFGHFLGNFKSKFGIQRERSSFVFTLEMAHAMGGTGSELFKQFKKHCHAAYNLVRKHGRRLINFFKLMISAGMPELQEKSEIEYIRDMLSLKLTDSEADDKFNEEIDTALNNTFRRLDNLIHNLRRN